MLDNFRKTFVLVTLVTIVSTGCRDRKQYEDLANAGNTYTLAVDKLLIKARELQIESSSEMILLDDRISNQTPQQYRKISEKDREILAAINGIRSHNQLLQKYFFKLNELATSKAPEQTKTEIDKIANNLDRVSKNLSKTIFYPNRNILQGIGNLIISSKIKGSLREELEKRDRIILAELTIQQEMLRKLSEFMEFRVEVRRNAKEQRFVIRPLIKQDNIANEDNWIAKRKDIFAIDNRVEDLKSASEALKNFKDIFKDTIEDKITTIRLNNALRDIDTFLALLENQSPSDTTGNP